MLLDLLRHLVALEHVLECGDLEAKLIGQPQQHQDLVCPVTMRVHQPLAFQHLHQRFQTQVTARRKAAGAGLMPLPGGLILARFHKGLPMTSSTPMRVPG